MIATRRPSTYEQRWAKGAEGEELIGASLESRARAEVFLLHDRRMPGTRANIDHIAVAPTGVWVIDAKNYRGKAEVRGRGPSQELWIAGRDRTKLVESLARQVEVVTRLVGEIAPRTPIHGAFCFLDTNMTLFRKLTVRGFPLCWCKGMAKRLNADGPVPLEHAELIAASLGTRLPAA